MNNGYHLLREAIVQQAVDDTRALVAGRKIDGAYSIQELRRFFRGKWGAALIGNLDGELIFQRLMAGEKYMTNIQTYEAEKAKLKKKNLSPEQYEAEVKKIAKKLKI